MNFTEYLRDRILLERLKEHRILVVFDPEGRYEAICQSLADKHTQVISSAGRPVSARLEVLNEWKNLCADTTLRSQLVLYTRDAPPTMDDEKRSHPFTAFVTAGSQFPDGPKDDYQQLCYRFLPDRRTEITQLFSSTNTPSLTHIDSLAGGAHAHPRLESIFGTGEVTKILLRFLAPDSTVKESLEGGTDWCEEFRQLTERTLGFRFDPRATQADTIRTKLWQYLLFSEFAIDLPVTMPEGLSALPQAEGTAIPVVLELCQELRKNHQTKEAYREAANVIESQLDLPGECEGLADLGCRDTFSFEECRFLSKAITAKEQLNKRKNDDEFANINLGYFNTRGEEIIVSCPESVGVLATLEPKRQQNQELAPPPSATEITPNPLVERPAASAPPATTASAAAPALLKEGELRLYHGDRGGSYRTLFFEHLQGSKQIHIEDPYIRSHHQVVTHFDTAGTGHPRIQLPLLTSADIYRVKPTPSGSGRRWIPPQIDL